MLATTVVLGLALSAVLASIAPGSCPPNIFWWFANTNCSTLPERNWTYRVISYDPFEYSRLHTIFHYGQVPLDCLQVDFRCVRTKTQKKIRYHLGTLWFRCTDNPAFQHRALVTESVVHSAVLYAPKPECIPVTPTTWSTVYVNIIEGKHILLTTCRSENSDDLGVSLKHYKAHLLLSSGPVEDDLRVLAVARGMFNLTFNYWTPKEAVVRSCRCDAYKEFMQKVLRKDCDAEKTRKGTALDSRDSRGNNSAELQSNILIVLAIYLVVLAAAVELA